LPYTTRFRSSAPASSRRPSFVMLNAMQWPVGKGLAGRFLQEFRDAAAHGELPSSPLPRDIGDEALWWGDGLAVRKADVSFGLSVFIPHLKSAAKRPPGMFEEQLAPYILKRLSATESSARRH